MSDTINARDTQFQGFANALFEELQAIEVEGLKNNWNNIDIYRRQREAIARQAYNLVQHAVRHGCTDNVDYAMRYIPDMTELSKEQE